MVEFAEIMKDKPYSSRFKWHPDILKDMKYRVACLASGLPLYQSRWHDEVVKQLKIIGRGQKWPQYFFDEEQQLHYDFISSACRKIYGIRPMQVKAPVLLPTKMKVNLENEGSKRMYGNDYLYINDQLVVDDKGACPIKVKDMKKKRNIDETY